MNRTVNGHRIRHLGPGYVVLTGSGHEMSERASGEIFFWIADAIVHLVFTPNVGTDKIGFGIIRSGTATAWELRLDEDDALVASGDIHVPKGFGFVLDVSDGLREMA